MFNVIDLLWLEQRGMSIITSIFFLGTFVTFVAMFWWFRKELDYVYTTMSNHAIRLNNNKEELSALKTQLAVIRAVVENTEAAVNRLVDKIYK